MEWRLAEAKNRFSELVNTALVEGPQVVRRRSDVVVVMAAADYQRLTRSQPTFKDHLLNPPTGIAALDLSRDTSPMREISL